MSGRLEQVYLPSDPRLEWPGEGPLFELNLNKCWGQNVGTIRVIAGPLLMSGLGPLIRKGTSVNHCHMSLSMFIKFVENNVPINQQEG